MALEVIGKIEIHCEECGNDAKILTYSNEEVAFCPFCGEPIVLEYDDDEDELEDDDSWDDDGGR